MSVGWSRHRRSTVALGLVSLFAAGLIGYEKIDLTPQLRDHYMGQTLLEPYLFLERVQHDDLGNPILDEVPDDPVPESSDSSDAP